MFVYTILSAFVFLMAPSIAHAWGPGTHIEIAFSLIEKLVLMAPAVRAVIAGREEWFIYGNVAADIVVGKKFAGEHYHCHNWRIGHQVLKSAKTDRERAAAYGYLAHLAADVVAHNYFIPYKIVDSYKAQLTHHTYWEMRFDMHVRNKVWEQMSKIVMADYSPFNKLLESTLKRALFSFKASKQIFSGILALQKFKQFRRTFSFYAKRSRFGLDTETVSHYMRLAVASAMGYLKNPENGAAIQYDPTGAENISYARKLRREIKKRVRNRELNKHEVEKLLIVVKKKFYNDIAGVKVV